MHVLEQEDTRVPREPAYPPSKEMCMPWCAVVYKHEYNTWSGAQGIDIGSILFQGLIR